LDRGHIWSGCTKATRRKQTATIKCRRWIMKLELRAGVGCRIRDNFFGQKVISFSGGGNGFTNFSHPWKTTLQGNQLVIQPGQIQSIQACINKIPLAGDDKNPPPKLQLDLPLDVNDDKCTWLCAQIEYDPKKNNTVIAVEMVMESDLDNGADIPYAWGGSIDLPDNKANCPVTMLRQMTETSKIEIYDICFFDMFHGVELAKNGKTVSRHFFW
jgi:hypothetical protein